MLFRRDDNTPVSCVCKLFEKENPGINKSARKQIQDWLESYPWSLARLTAKVDRETLAKKVRKKKLI